MHYSHFKTPDFPGLKKACFRAARRGVLIALCAGAFSIHAGAAEAPAATSHSAGIPAVSSTPASAKPLFRDFMGINGHFTFKPELYRQVCRIVRNYHNLNWDVKQPGDAITLPVCVNQVNWKTDVYGRWQKAGFETDICVQLSGFQPDVPRYPQFWTGKEQWCFDYGLAMARCFGPSSKDKLCTSIEIGNEPGAKFEAALFKSIFMKMAQGIRQGDPRIKIVTPAVQARPGDDYSQDLLGWYGESDILPFYDVINLHTYASVERTSPADSPWNRSYPEDSSIAYLQVVDEAVQWRDTHAKGKEIWITEFGYDACTPEALKRRDGWFLKLDWRGVTDLQQAQYLVRSFLVFAERDVQRAFLYFYDDKDSPSVHGSSGLTRKFAPKMSFWAVKQLYEILGEYRFRRVVEKIPGDLFIDEFAHGGDPRRKVWIAWSPTGARTDEREGWGPRERKVTLNELPALPVQILGMATARGEVPQPAWEKTGPTTITLTVGESPVYILMGGS